MKNNHISIGTLIIRIIALVEGAHDEHTKAEMRRTILNWVRKNPERRADAELALEATELSPWFAVEAVNEALGVTQDGRTSMHAAAMRVPYLNSRILVSC